jgi:hypothetical protein
MRQGFWSEVMRRDKVNPRWSLQSARSEPNAVQPHADKAINIINHARLNSSRAALAIRQLKSPDQVAGDG